MIAADRIRFLQGRIAAYHDQQAYKELYTGFYSSLFSFAIHLIESRHLAEEILSDVFINIWKHRHTLDRIENLRVYLFTAVRNGALNCLEQQHRHATVPMEDEIQITCEQPEDPEQLLITAEMKQLIQRAIDSLPNRCRLVFRLVKEEGLRYKEVADIMGTSIKTVENQMTIALSKISSAIRFDIHKTLPTPLTSTR